jgi:hypothetical protein
MRVSDRLLLPRYAVSGDPMFGTVEVTIEELAEFARTPSPSP